MNNSLFYKDKSVFGLDIGFSSMKVMQLERDGRKIEVTGYGVIAFDSSAIKEGVIVDPETLAKSAYELFDRHLIGDVTTRRVVMAIPAARAFSRNVQLPKLNRKEDLDESVRAEAEQYIPQPLDDMYLDYEIISETDELTDLQIVAVSKKIVDSYMSLARILGLEVAAIDTTIGADSRLFMQAETTDVPTVLIDFGSLSTDITIFDGRVLVTGTVPGGGDSFTKLISDSLGVSLQEAHVIKSKYGLGVSKRQKEINDALTPLLEQLLKEVRRNIRYYEERSDKQSKIGQIITMGGGANIPGLAGYMTNKLRLPVRMCDPWKKLEFGGLQPPNQIEKSLFITVAGLGLLQPKEIFK